MERYSKAMERARRERELAHARRVLAKKSDATAPADTASQPAEPAPDTAPQPDPAEHPTGDSQPNPSEPASLHAVPPPDEPAPAAREEDAPSAGAQPRRPRVVPKSSHPVVFERTRVVPVDARKLREQRVITGADDDPYADLYRMLRTRLLQRMRQNEWHSIAITSPGTSAGKSLTAVNLAISLAMEVTQTVLLVDFDLRRPAIHRYFGIEPELGISDLLLRNVPLNEIAFSPSIDRLVVVPGRERMPNSTELMSAPRTIELVREFTTRYPDRIVIFDLPPVLTVSDALAFSPQVDAMLLVVEDGVTQQEELAATMELLENTNIIGTVLNKAQEIRDGYYHY
ncbi:hypothetical protein BH24PSE2_BH24PSE2_19020 [soil metagenome]